MVAMYARFFAAAFRPSAAARSPARAILREKNMTGNQCFQEISLSMFLMYLFKIYALRF